MIDSCLQNPPENIAPRWSRWTDWRVLLIVTFLAYAGGLSGPFVFDDTAAITENPSIEHLWPVWSVLSPPSHRTVTGRPIANLTLAINHAFGGANPFGYHVFNIVVHVGAGFLLLGVIRRTLLLPALAPRFGAVAQSLAFFAALLWLLHPLQTEAVTYVIQRVESLMGFFYLLTLYGFVRAVQGGASKGWFAVSVVACLLGMGTKEVMVSAPLMVLLYDRGFIAGNFATAWRQRRGYYLTLAATWLWLGWLVLGADNRSGSAGLGTSVSPWHYALTQCRAIVDYLHLTVWPHPLIFDYGTGLAQRITDVWPQALLVSGLLAGTGWLLVRGASLGFLGAWFFAILAPSSSFVPIATQSIAEHRMYLALAAPVLLFVLGLYRWIGCRGFVVTAVVAAALGGLTFARNRDYRTAEAIWLDTLAKNPAAPRACNAIGNLRADAHDPVAAARFFAQAIAVDPTYAEARNNLGTMLHRQGRREEAVAEFRRALDFQPDYSAAHFNLANLLVEMGRGDEARREYRQVLALTPGQPDTLRLLAPLEMQAGEIDAATAHLQELIQLRPSELPAYFNLAFLLSRQGRLNDAIALMQAATREDPHSAMAAYNLGNALAQAGRFRESADAYLEAIRLDSKLVAAHFNLGNTYGMLGRYADAAGQYEIVLALEPSHPQAAASLVQARLKLAGGGF